MGRLLRAVLLCVLVLWSAAPVEASYSPWLDGAELEFVDAVGSTGYYVDKKSISVANQDECVARVMIVRAADNRMYIYSTLFNRKVQTYQIFHTVVLQYDTKEELSVSERPMKPVGYMKGSPMYTIVEYIYEVPKNR